MEQEKNIWSLDIETGEWTLAEPYASEVARIRHEITVAFNTTLFEEVAKISPYSVERLHDEYVRMCYEREQVPTDMITSFVVEAMTGQFGK